MTLRSRIAWCEATAGKDAGRPVSPLVRSHVVHVYQRSWTSHGKPRFASRLASAGDRDTDQMLTRVNAAPDGSLGISELDPA